MQLIKMINSKALELVLKVLVLVDLEDLKKLLRLCLVVVLEPEDFSLILVVKILAKLVLEQEVVLVLKDLVAQEDNIINNKIMMRMTMADKDKKINLKKLI